MQYHWSKNQFRKQSYTIITLFLLNFLTMLSVNTIWATEWLDNFVDESTASANFRYRYEWVDQEGIDKEAGASTLKTRLNWQSGRVNNVLMFIEVDDVSTIGEDNYNSTINGKNQYPVVADPEGTEVNQAYVKYSGLDNTVATLGRQRINHNDQRFVGGVAWRQNEQTYDGANIKTKFTDNFSTDVSYVYNVNRIFGEDSIQANLRGDLGLLNAIYRWNKEHVLKGFYYHLDFDDAITSSSSTLGLDYNHRRKISEIATLAFTATYMRQSDIGDNPNDYDSDYYRLKLRYSRNGWWGTLGYEVFGADDGVAFSTPLATLHKFQGFADKFLAIPENGLEDLYLVIGAKYNKFKWSIQYHDFASEEGSQDYGQEVDFVGQYAVTKQFDILFKYASYSADDFSVDTDKFWFMVSTKL